MKKLNISVIILLSIVFLTVSCKKDPIDIEEIPEEVLAVVPKVLVLGADDPIWLVDVKNKIDSTNLVESVDVFNSNDSLPGLSLLKTYDVLFIYTNYNPVNSTTFGDTIAAYIEDGGAVVDATFTGNIPVTGNFTQYALLTGTNQANPGVTSIGSILVDDHMILENVVTFNGGTSSYHNTGGVIDDGAYIVAKYDNEEPLIIAKEDVGPMNTKRVFLNFFPPSIDVRDDFWDTTTDGALLMAGALLWVCN